MAHEIKNAFKEVVDRLQASEAETGTGTPGLLAGVRLVEGPVEEIYEHKHLPVIQYEILDGGFSEDSHFPDRARFKFKVLFTIYTDAKKGYYSADGLGIIDVFEKLMTVLDTNMTTRAVDLTGAGNWGPITPQYRVGSFDRDGLKNTYLMEAEFQTVRYGRGGLRP